MRRSLVLIAGALSAALAAAAAPAQQPTAGDSAYARTEAKIPMRDGVKLHVVIFAPRGAAAPLPILLQRTPYNANGAIGVARRAKEIGLDGYIIVFGDIRGRFGSEGTFDMNRPPRLGSQSIDESTDAYDTIEWLVKNLPNNNGKVGSIGVSYPRGLTAGHRGGPPPPPQRESPPGPPGGTRVGGGFFPPGGVP